MATCTPAVTSTISRMDEVSTCDVMRGVKCGVLFRMSRIPFLENDLLCVLIRYIFSLFLFVTCKLRNLHVGGRS